VAKVVEPTVWLLFTIGMGFLQTIMAVVVPEGLLERLMVGAKVGQVIKV
jgi:hypothetical protein